MAHSSNEGRARKARPFAQQQRSPLHAIWENVRGFGVVLAIFFLVRIFLVEAYRIPSGSMIPTLLIGDWLFVNKLAYGPNIPFTGINLPGYDEPARNDVIVFVSPPQQDEAERGNELQPTLVKRAVGTSGDTLYMRNAILYVNGIAQPPRSSATDLGEGDSVDPLFDWQKPVGLRSSRFGAAPAQPSHDNWGPLVVPPRSLFMMGDNRYNSKDSRYWGFVPRANVRGRPMFVYYSYNADDSDRPLPFITDIRWSRIGHWIR